MQLTFFIEYHSRWGEQLFLSGEPEALGGNDESRALPMLCTGNGQWAASVEMPAGAPFVYRYFVRENGRNSRQEEGRRHTFRPRTGVEAYRIYDAWQITEPDAPFLSSAFLNGRFFERPLSTREELRECGVRFEVTAPALLPQESVAIVGTFTESAWNEAQAVVLSDRAYPVWSVTLPADVLRTPIEYKFVVIDKTTRRIVAWEAGNNRRLSLLPPKDDETVIVAGAHLRLVRPLWRGAGVAIPVFSLKSQSSWGIGEFLDLEKMIDWAVLTGQKFIQVLPINDTTMRHTWLDSYPYRANSVYALHPAYLHLPAAGRLHDVMEMMRFEKEAERLNALPAVDYEAVTKLKSDYLRRLFAEQGEALLATPEFRDFFQKNKTWLVPYAVYCYLRDKNGTPVFAEWDEYAVYDAAKVARLASKESEAYPQIALHYFIQYHLHTQLLRVKKYALSHGVALKGDIPIGVSRDSADAWTNPQLFNFGMQAGAPPDDFSVTGQNWGFPTYNWAEMAKDGYAWWKARFVKMAEYFDAYRIDHILGFFRIWEIPDTAVEGLLGHFNAALPYTAGELAACGFAFDERRHAAPYIREYMLSELFGEYRQEVEGKYLLPQGGDTYALRPEVDTQQKIVARFGDAVDKKTSVIVGGLLRLTDEVLFVADPYAPAAWHPRIAARGTYSFAALSGQEQETFSRLHDDFYYRRHNLFWKEEALKKLPPLLSSTGMLVCGEDLGMIPESVPEVMNRLQILSLEIQRMPKEPHCEFGDTTRYPYLSVCTTSTHDMSGIRGWWEENPAATQRYYNAVLGQEGDAPVHCPPHLCRAVIEKHLQSPAMLAILPLQDWLSISLDVRRTDIAAERINVPADTRNYWRYRMHLTLENLLQQTELNNAIRTLISASRRTGLC